MFKHNPIVRGKKIAPLKTRAILTRKMKCNSSVNELIIFMFIFPAADHTKVKRPAKLVNQS